MAFPSETWMAFPSETWMAFPSETWMAFPSETWMAFPSERAQPFPSETVGGPSRRERGRPFPSETWTLAMRLPGAPGKGRCGQLRGRQERGRAVEVQRVERRAGRGVARGERGQVPLLLDEPEHRRVVEYGRADVIRPRIRRHDHGGDPEPVPVIPVRAAGLVLLAADHAGKDRPQARLQRRRGADRAAPLDVVGRDCRGRRHVVVVSAVLVVDPDQQGVRPAAAVQDRVDHLRGKTLALA